MKNYALYNESLNSTEVVMNATKVIPKNLVAYSLLLLF